MKGAAEYKRIAKSEARAGDYVKFDEAPRGYLTAGKYYEIDYVDSNGDPYITDDAGDVFDTYCLDDDEFEVYRKVSAESVEAEPKTERLKVGDYAKVVKNVRSHEVEVGTLLLVTAIDNEPPFIKCDELSGNRIGWFYEDELVRATDDEVAEAKRAAKWAEIGREVGEYKKGDFVKLTLRSGGIFFGEITEHRVGNTYGFKHLHAEYGTTSEYSRDLTLVTPVEARFDR
ncbi:hypothetical protein [Bacillus subtilis]|uniref:hypothetical protein n=1 Tax=Bacillus subtilis TaxID=1423 RepID=UPI0018CDFD80|nr:hypothetical protein [Bacillus subtilis]